MSSDEILEDFKKESKSLIEQMIEILELVESDLSQFEKLEDYGLYVDRIMGAAKSLAITQEHERNHPIHTIAKYSELCKAVAYRSAQVVDNDTLKNVSVALLLDATEVLEHLVDELGQEDEIDLDKHLRQTFYERLKWVNSQFSDNLRASVGVTTSNKDNNKEIENLMKSLGMN